MVKIKFLTAVMFCLFSVTTWGKLPPGFAILADFPEVTDVNSSSGNAVFNASSDEIERGFAVTVIETSQDIGPAWVWTEKKDGMKVVLCRGQYKAAAFAVRTLDKAKKLSISCDGLVSDSGARITSQNIDIRLVQYIKTDSNSIGGKWLGNGKTVKSFANWTSWVWLTFSVPENSYAGDYHGLIKIKDNESHLASIEVILTVPEIKLEKAQANYGFYIPAHFYNKGCGSYANYAVSSNWQAKNLDTYFKFWKSRGFNSPALYHYYPQLKCVDGNAVFEPGSLAEFVKAYKSAGLDGDICIDMRWIGFWAGSASEKIAELSKEGKSPQGDIGVYGPDGHEYLQYDATAKKLFRQAVLQLLAKAKKEHWPKLKLLAEEEMTSYPVKMAGYESFMPILKEIAPQEAYIIDMYVCVAEKMQVDRGARDNIKTRQYLCWTEHAMETARRQNANIWAYNFDMPRVLRVTWGFYQHRLGSTGYHQWAEQWAQSSEREAQYWYANLLPNGVISSIQLERARDGINDRDYLWSLERIAERLEKSGKTQQAHNARKVLSEVISDISVEREEYNRFKDRVCSSELDRRILTIVSAIKEANASLN